RGARRFTIAAFFYCEQNTAYELLPCLEFRRVLFRSPFARASHPALPPEQTGRLARPRGSYEGGPYAEGFLPWVASSRERRTFFEIGRASCRERSEMWWVKWSVWEVRRAISGPRPGSE